jgi:hypothetical protein
MSDRVISYGPLARFNNHAGRLNCCCFNSIILIYIAFTYILLKFIFPSHDDVKPI